MSAKPVIGISSNFVGYQRGRKGIPDVPLGYLKCEYVSAVIRSGGVPLVLPVTSRTDIVADMLSTVDAVVLSGGGDIDPRIIGERRYSATLKYVRPVRDVFELSVLKQASIPILGICRGHQLIAIGYGGSLYQDISESGCDPMLHKAKPSGERAYHPVQIVEGSLLHGVLGETEIIVNSSHHQAVNVPPKGFIASAFSHDGVIEAIEGRTPRGAQVLGVQWHPEAMSDRIQKRLFDWLVETASR